MIHNRGFTLIEVLAVSVVISIVAGIIIITYPNLTNNARKAAIEESVLEYKKLLTTYVAKNGQYPAGQNSACLGESSWYTTKNCYTSPAPTNTQATTTALSPIASNNLPSIKQDCYRYKGSCVYNLLLRYEPLATIGSDPMSYQIVYFFSGNTKCSVEGSVGGTSPNYTVSLNNGKNYDYEASSNTTMCVARLPMPDRL
jgi:prepilin-type N-terminal cleavage/methylation domain-containing protein